MVNLLIITHGEFGAYLVEAAEEIVGRQDDVVRAVSISPRLGLDEVRRRIRQAVLELDGPEGLIVATDIPGGTPVNIALPLVAGLPKVGVVSGLNLYMLVSAFQRRKTCEMAGVLSRMIEDAQRSVRDIKAALAAR